MQYTAGKGYFTGISAPAWTSQAFQEAGEITFSLHEAVPELRKASDLPGITQLAVFKDGGGGVGLVSFHSKPLPVALCKTGAVTLPSVHTNFACLSPRKAFS